MTLSAAIRRGLCLLRPRGERRRGYGAESGDEFSSLNCLTQLHDKAS
jgi:hypothetical protein